MALYAEECEFADPFTSFNGRDRFVQNLKHLGKQKVRTLRPESEVKV